METQLGVPPIQVFEMVDTGKIDDGIDESRLLRAAIHLVRVRDLDRSRGAMIGCNRLRAFSHLLGIRSGERF